MNFGCLAKSIGYRKHQKLALDATTASKLIVAGLRFLTKFKTYIRVSKNTEVET